MTPDLARLTGFAPVLGFTFAASVLLTAALIPPLSPLMRRYATARPTARGLHATPTPQGGGLPIMIAAIAVTIAAGLWAPPLSPLAGWAWVPLLGAAVLATLGAADDVLHLSARLRLFVQFAVAAAVVAATPAAFSQGFGAGSVAGALWTGVAVVGLVWFVNLTNFMDGMDGMTVVGLGVPAAFAALANLAGAGDPASGLFCLAALGGLIGFAPFNWPRARLFLGDVGSLALGLVVGVALLRLAGAGHLAAALIAPLYHLADSGVTLARRAARGENLAQAHRSHFYQLAVTGGMSAKGVLARVGALNAALATLAGVSLIAANRWVDVVALGSAAALTGLTLCRLARGA